METKDKFLECFVSGPAVLYDADQTTKNAAAEKGKLFRSYIWSESGISNLLKMLKHEKYGDDLLIILFQYYINPLPLELQHLKDIESYRKKEKAIGIPIVVTDETFFNVSEKGRQDFIKQSILRKLELLEDVVKKKKLDTKIDLLKGDLRQLFNI